MELGKLFALVGTEGFWGGVLSSIVAALILAIFGIIFRHGIMSARHSWKRRRDEGEMFNNAMNVSSPYAPFAFGVAQGRALRLFITAVFVAYIGDILSAFIFPFSTLAYVAALAFLFMSLQWFYRIERRAAAIFSSQDKSR